MLGDSFLQYFAGCYCNVVFYMVCAKSQLKFIMHTHRSPLHMSLLIKIVDSYGASTELRNETVWPHLKTKCYKIGCLKVDKEGKLKVQNVMLLTSIMQQRQ